MLSTNRKIVGSSLINQEKRSLYSGNFFFLMLRSFYVFTHSIFSMTATKLMCELRKFAGNAIVFMRNLMTELSFVHIESASLNDDATVFGHDKFEISNFV